MKLTQLLSNLITETSRLEIVYDKYVKPNSKLSQNGQPPRGIMTFETLKTIIFGDPTTNPRPENFDVEGATVKEMESVRIGKYVQWMLKNYTQPVLEFEVGSDEYKMEAKEYRRLFIEDLPSLSVDLLKYNRFKGSLPLEQREITKLTPETLSDAVEDFKLNKKSMSKKEEKITKENPYNYPASSIDFVGPNWTVVKISEDSKEGKSAACYFGGYYDLQDEFDETNWCTSNPTGTNFDGYIKDGPLYVILPNSSAESGQKTGLPKYRYQFHFHSNQFKDRRNRGIDLPDFFNSIAPELKDYFEPKFQKFPYEFNTTYERNNTCEISIRQNSKMAIYVSVYGNNSEPFDFNAQIKKTFEEIKTSITVLNLLNSTAMDINLDIPDNIGRFNELESLHFIKCVKTIPTTICQLKNLTSIALINCVNLVEIPECTVNLANDSLTFLNLAGSNPNVKIPEKIKQYHDDNDPGMYFIFDGEDDEV